MKRTLRSAKSRGGCQACKIRRIKCDETKPACQICRANGFECPGFEKSFKWSRKHELLPSPVQSGRSVPIQWHRENSECWSSPVTNDSELPLAAPSQSDDGRENHHAERNVSPALPTTEDPGHSLAIDWPSFEACGFEDLGFSNMPMAGTTYPVLSAELWSQRFVPTLPSDAATIIPPETPGVDQHAIDTFNSALQSPTSPRTCEESEQCDDEHVDTTEEQQFPGVGSNRYLETYYRLSLPGQVSGLSDEDFVNHYFNNVCAIYSCFDSESNPFRTLVGEKWTSSATLYLAIQSMAVGHLANYYPHLGPLGLQKRSQAWKYLQTDLQLHRVGKRPTDTVLLSLLLLGPSSAWHQASNIGMEYLFIARNLMQLHLQNSTNGESSRSLPNETFFQNAFLYWEMLASFVDPVPLIPLPGHLRLPQPDHPSAKEPMTPHPWTGLVVEVQFALAEIGRVLRRHRTYSSARTAGRGGDFSFSQAEKEWTTHLLEFLHSIDLPTTDEVVDYDDIKTPKADLILAADAFRFIGLLEIYGLFPDLLRTMQHKDFGVSGFQYSLPSHHTAYNDDSDSWLAAIAVHVLDLIKAISISSSACRLLPLLLVASAGQLWLPTSTATPDEIYSQQNEAIVQARYLVEARMLVLSRKYPQRPMLQMVDIVTEVWQRLDNGSTHAHWLDVAHEKGWQTIMG